MTFVVGLLLGGAVMASAGGRDDGNAAAPGSAVTAAPSPVPAPDDRNITVPASCAQGLERARTALSTVGEAVEAARDFNSARLQELLDRLQDTEQEVERLSRQCRTEVTERN
ncbi:hypothetical protein [Paractinoplanes hotanensis]|uniref:Secreted protein n=1 Tax=Paractinoplanes hotanensis TaxID=2906497 RepID=A0ABT0YCS6_9ACTN|nr:hypothetical protein [Actinoplanes hotanensis]MCM4083871.1 hypothetical protein [Actinoplanes hotanensis]